MWGILSGKADFANQQFSVPGFTPLKINQEYKVGTQEPSARAQERAQ